MYLNAVYLNWVIWSPIPDSGSLPGEARATEARGARIVVADVQRSLEDLDLRTRMMASGPKPWLGFKFGELLTGP